MGQHTATMAVPAGMDFAALRLARKPDGAISFDWSPIETICTANGIDVDVFRNAPEDNVAALIVAWYQGHLANGGDRDATAEDLIGEVLAEDAAGSLSHQPGRA